MKRFHSVLRRLKSPENVGLVVRQHVAFGGGKVIFVGDELPWRFKKSTQAFSRRLERICEILHFPTDDAFFAWARGEGVAVHAIEIAPGARSLPGVSLEGEMAIVVGNESAGLPADFLARCDGIIAIPQFGEVACLNAAVSAILVMYELRRADPCPLAIVGNRYDVPADR